MQIYNKQGTKPTHVVIIDIILGPCASSSFGIVHSPTVHDMHACSGHSLLEHAYKALLHEMETHAGSKIRTLNDKL